MLQLRHAAPPCDCRCGGVTGRRPGRRQRTAASPRVGCERGQPADGANAQDSWLERGGSGGGGGHGIGGGGSRRHGRRASACRAATPSRLDSAQRAAQGRRRRRRRCCRATGGFPLFGGGRRLGLPQRCDGSGRDVGPRLDQGPGGWRWIHGGGSPPCGGGAPTRSCGCRGGGCNARRGRRWRGCRRRSRAEGRCGEGGGPR